MICHRIYSEEYKNSMFASCQVFAYFCKNRNGSKPTVKFRDTSEANKLINNIEIKKNRPTVVIR